MKPDRLMARRKRLCVEENGDSLRVTLDIEGVKGWKWRRDNPKPARVRTALPEVSVLIHNAQQNLVSNEAGETADDWLRFYIRFRQMGIAEHFQDVRKAIKRITLELECIAIANSLIQDGRKVDP